MFTGYYFLYYDMPHLSVEVELPMALWATELLMRRITKRRIAALGGTIGLVILGGMPESAFLLLTVSTLYAILRLFTLPGARFARIVALAGAYALGLALGAIEFIPFLELLTHGSSTHDAALQKGLGFDGGWYQGLLTEFFPRAFGNPWTSILTKGVGWTGIRGFFGVSAFYLAAVAVASSLLKRDGRFPTVAFLAGCAAYGLLKRFGNPGVNWTGGLPLFVQIEFPKYIEAVTGPAIALLAGFGVGYIGERTRELRAQWIGFAATLTLVSLVFITTRTLLPYDVPVRSYMIAIAIGMFAFIGTAAAGVVISRSGDTRRRRVAAFAIITVLTAEPLVGYALPAVFVAAPPVARDPYAGAPYLTYIANHMDTSKERIFGISGMLFPNWASVYALPDVRSIEAVAMRDYLPFVDAFITDKPATSDDQSDRFVATRPIDMGAPLVRRWMDLSSVHYVVDPYVANMKASPAGTILNSLVEQASRETSDADRPAVHQASAEIDGIAESVFFEHPPHDIIFRTDVPARTPRLIADIALDPSTYAGSICGGPVTFSLRAVRGNRELAIATRTIDPKHVISERHWLPFFIDLTSFAGHAVDLHFVTAAKDTCSAWAIWGEPRFVARTEHGVVRQSGSLYPLAFQSPGANVFEVRGSLPRFSLFHVVRPTASISDAIMALKEPAFDVHRTLLVEGDVPHTEPQHGAEGIVVRRLRSDRVELTAVVTSDAVLMQNDSWYPGWKATVDGHVIPIERVDGIFRGIPLSAGEHRVVIEYASMTALVGLIFTLIGSVVFVALLFDVSSRQRKAPF
jgi:hypothetical protein